jgi:hypothetical protein
MAIILRSAHAIDTSEGIHLRQIVLDGCPLSSEHCHMALHGLAHAVEQRFQQRGSIDRLDRYIQHRREAVSLCSKCEAHLNDLASSPIIHQGNSRDLNEATSRRRSAAPGPC